MSKLTPFEIAYYAIWGLFWFFVLALVLPSHLFHPWLFWASYLGGVIIMRLLFDNPFTVRKDDDDDDLF